MNTSSLRRIVAPALVLAVLLLPAALIAQGATATEEQLQALHTQALWIDDISSRMEAGGTPMSDSALREMRLINAELTLLDRARTASYSGTGVVRADAEALQDRMAKLWTDLRRGSAAVAPAPAVANTSGGQGMTFIPAGTHAEVTLATWLSSKNAVVGDRFSAALTQPILSGSQVLVPAGVIFEGVVTRVDRAGRASDGGQLHLLIDRVRGEQGQIADVRGLVVGTGSGDPLKGKSVSGGKTAAGAVVGGILGGLIDGKEGALIGIGVGAGGTLLAERGKEVDLPQGTVLRVEVQQQSNVPWTWAAR